MSTKQAVKPKQYLFLDENKELYVEGTEKEFLEVVVGNGENPEDIYYKIDPIHVEKIRVESKIVKA